MEDLDNNIYLANDNTTYNIKNEDDNNKNNMNDYYKNNYNENINNNKENKLDKNSNGNIPIDNSIINLLIEIPFIKILPSYTIQDICHIISTKKYKKSEMVLRQGEPISNIYIIKTGSFKVSINHSSSVNISQDINSFIKYQNITNEPFLEERKYELEGKLNDHQQLPLFIYQRYQFFGDVELVTGKKVSSFTIQANEDNSSLCFMDRQEWVKLTKRIRIPFTKAAIDKLNRIQNRILDILERKNKNNIDKIKLCKDKINYQIEINDNYDSYVKKINKKEEKLEKEKEKEIKKLKDKKIYMKLYPKEKELQQFQSNKNNILNIFKYPNILKDETKIYLKKNFNMDKREIRKVKINQSKSFLNIEPHINKSNISSNENISKNYELHKFKSRLFLTNSIKLKNKNNSMNDIFNSTISPTKTKIKNDLSSTINFYNSGSKNKSIYNNSSQINNNGINFKETQNKYKVQIKILNQTTKKPKKSFSLDDEISENNNDISNKIKYSEKKDINYTNLIMNNQRGQNNNNEIKDDEKIENSEKNGIDKQINIEKQNLIEKINNLIDDEEGKYKEEINKEASLMDSKVNNENQIPNINMNSENKKIINEYSQVQEIKCIICSKNYIKKNSNSMYNEICQDCLKENIIKKTSQMFFSYMEDSISNKNHQLAYKTYFNEFIENKIDILNEKISIKNALLILDNKYKTNIEMHPIFQEMKKNFCIFCLEDLDKTKFEIPCKCNFCSIEHIKKYFHMKNNIKNKSNYVCICSHEYTNEDIYNIGIFICIFM